MWSGPYANERRETTRKATADDGLKPFCHTDLDTFAYSKRMGFEQLRDTGLLCVKNALLATYVRM